MTVAERIADHPLVTFVERRREPRPYRIAAIDVGTNSIHMIIAEAQRHGYRVIDKEKHMVQLGRGSLEGKMLTEDAFERGVSTLRSMADIARRHQVNDVVAVATSAIREAPNRRRFINEVQKAAGVKLRVISGEEEADYIYRAVRAAVDFHGGTALSIDIGGGSVEMIVGTTAEVFFTRSEPAGALRITQKFDLGSAVSDERLKKCRRYVRKLLKKPLARIASIGFDFTIGTSGTITTLAALAVHPDAATSGLRWLTKARVRDVIAQLAPLSAAERAKTFSIDEKRAETLLGGAVVLDEIMRGLDLERLRSCDTSLREGIVESMLDRRNTAGNDATGVRGQAVLELAERTHIDMVHAAHVAKLALRIFDQLEESHPMQIGDRQLLEAAAMLHEAGMHVSFAGHHKHSFYIISHAGLRGFTSDQVMMIANISRYYRKKAPDPEHENFAQLSPAQQDTVVRLAAILRIAAALDRGRHGAVRDVTVEPLENVVSFLLHVGAGADVEIDEIEKKARHFSRVFARRVEVRVEGT